MPIRIITWNVNGLRSAVRNGFAKWLRATAPDVVCLQEVRATLDQLRPLEPLFSGYRAIWHPAIRPGYAGVAVLTRWEPVQVEYGLDGDQDPEGRALTVDYGAFRVASLYAPNAVPGTSRIGEKCLWLERLRKHVLACSDKPFIVSGDLNVAYEVADSGGEVHPYGVNGCTDEERAGFRRLLEDGALRDPHRNQAGDSPLSTWWSAGRARSSANGMRYDYALIGTPHVSKVVDQAIHPDVGGSDHCPVSLTLDISVDGLRSARSVGQGRLV